MDIKDKIKQLQLVADEIDYCNYLLESSNFLQQPKNKSQAKIFKEASEIVALKIKKFLQQHVEKLKSNVDDSDLIGFSAGELSVLKLLASRFTDKDFFNDISKKHEEEAIDDIFDDIDNKNFSVPSISDVKKASEKSVKNISNSNESKRYAIVLDGTSIQKGDLKEVPPETKVLVLGKKDGILHVSMAEKPAYRFYIDEECVEYL